MLVRDEPRPRATELHQRPTRLRVLTNAGLGTIGITYSALLLYPKLVALMTGNLDVLGIGAIANLGLAFGSLMFLRQAQRERAALLSRPNEESLPR